MKQIKLGAYSLNVPQSWDEVTLGQHLQLAGVSALNDSVRNFAILCNVEFPVINESPYTIEDWDNLVAAFEWAGTKPNLYEYALPKTVTIEKKEIEVPSNLLFKTIGQKANFETLAIPFCRAGDDGKPFIYTEGITAGLAIYLQPAITGRPFDSLLLEETKEQMVQLSIPEAWGIITFFLNQLFPSSNGKKTFSHPKSAKKKEKPESKPLTSGL